MAIWPDFFVATKIKVLTYVYNMLRLLFSMLLELEPNIYFFKVP